MLGAPIVDPDIRFHDLVLLDTGPAVFVPESDTAVADQGYTVRDLRSGAVLASGRVAGDRTTATSIGGRAVVATATGDGGVRVYDLRTTALLGEFATDTGATQDVAAVEADGRTYLLIWGFDYTVHVFDLTTRIPS